jgi:hypothetical protein
VSYDDVALLRDERIQRHARSVLPAPPTRRDVPNVRKVDVCDLARRPVRGEGAAQAIPPVSGGAVLVPPVPRCAYRPLVLMLQAGGSIGLHADEHGYLELTVVDPYGHAVSVLANAEETRELACEIGGAS